MTSPRSASGTSTLVRAAGALPWRRRRGYLEVALVHRRAYDDWSWSKGKLEPGEEWPVAAVREVEEETGLRVRLGRPLPTSSYRVTDKQGRPARKQVRYWAGEVVGGDGRLLHEVDEVRWMDVAAASVELDHGRDREQLRALVRHSQAGALTTWPLVLVRHALARPRSSWHEPDPLRPLDERGRQRARDIVPLLEAFGVERIVSSTSLRCVDTMVPFARAAGIEMRTKRSLTEETFAADPDRAIARLRTVLDRGAPTAVCSHGPLLPTLVEELARHASTDAERDDVVRALHDAADSNLAKGELLVAHVVGRGEGSRIVAVERYAP